MPAMAYGATHRLEKPLELDTFCRGDNHYAMRAYLCLSYSISLSALCIIPVAGLCLDVHQKNLRSSFWIHKTPVGRQILVASFGDCLLVDAGHERVAGVAVRA